MEGVKGRLWKVKNKQRQHRETSKRGPRAELVGVDGDSVTPSSYEPPAYNSPWFLFLFAFLFINRRIFACFFFLRSVRFSLNRACSLRVALQIFRMQKKVDFVLCCFVWMKRKI